jgi:agmatinase
MAKVTPDQLTNYKSFDRPPFDFANESVTAFFESAVAQGYNLDTAGFLKHPGFFQAPHRLDLTEVDVAMVGSPLDLGAIGLSGTRHGPRAVREFSRNYGPVHDVTGQIPFDQCSIIDYGDVEWSATNLQVRLNNIYDAFHKLAQAGCTTLSCGGEHTTSFGVLTALSEVHNDSFGVIHIDAHCDTMAIWGGDTVNDGSIFRQAVLEGFIDPQRTVQIGIRGRANFLWEFSHDTGMTVISADEVFERGTQYVIDKAHEIVGQDKTYLSLDIDSLDSSYLMGTTGPEPFGLNPRQVRDIIFGARGLNIIGADMVELNPVRDTDGQSAHVAAALFFELLCLLCDSRAKRQPCSATRWT